MFRVGDRVKCIRGGHYTGGPRYGDKGIIREVSLYNYMVLLDVRREGLIDRWGGTSNSWNTAHDNWERIDDYTPFERSVREWIDAEFKEIGCA